MGFLKDECGQGAAEYLLLFGGVIVVAVVTLMIYRQYFNANPFDTAHDLPSVRSSTAAVS